ncbi:hypothetical protein HanRHA438_Chr09g0373961 [Helianthus annuus]|nr:hypothetical protein HanRHA438_Chr09g0373961 [Helianthus annuus]
MLKMLKLCEPEWLILKLGLKKKGIYLLVSRLEEERDLLASRLDEERKAREKLQKQLQEFMKNWCPPSN